MKHLKLTKFETCLCLISILVLILGFVFTEEKDVLNLVASIFGVVSLIYIAKGHLFGEILTLVFSILYAYISFKNRLYSELITYGFMYLPLTIITIVSWVKHPYKDQNTVEISKVSIRKFILIILSGIVFTFIFYFILRALNTASLYVSTFSIFTSFVASGLVIFRSPFYALAFMVNDLVLIVLWTIATISNPVNIVILLTFIIFFFNDIYGFIAWTKRFKLQQKNI